MNSIKKRLFLQIGSIIIALIALSILANTFLFSRFYMEREKSTLLNYYEQINNWDMTKEEDLYTFLRSIEAKTRADIVIQNTDKSIYYSSKINKITGGQLKPPPPRLKGDIIVHRIQINDKLNWVITKDEYDFKHIQLKGLLDNGNKIIMGIPLMAISNSIHIANRFTLIIGIILFTLGMIGAYLLSKSFTRPILDMNKRTNDLKKLHFGKACLVSSKDELGQLAMSINEMSIHLRDTIESLNTSNSELQQEVKHRIKLDEKRKQLLSNVSHELKTPIALLQGYAEGLKLNVAKNHGRTDFYCDVIMDEATKMNNLVQTLLDVNHIEFGDITLYETDFDCMMFISHIVEKYTPQFNTKDIDFTFNPLDNPVIVHGDQLKVEQVLTNYINNAIQYMDNRNIIKITTTQDKDHVRISVYNSCKPIPNSELPKLWDSFYKLDKARTREVGGHGLGLSIVKAIQEAMGNGYGVETCNDGIIFWFNIKKAEY